MVTAGILVLSPTSRERFLNIPSATLNGWTLRLLIFNLSSFLIYAIKAMNFPLCMALAVSHKF